MDVITIGDALVTMNPVTRGPLRFVNSFEKKAGGAELNVAVGCSRLGLQTGWISLLGSDEFGRYIRNFARGEGIDTSQVGFASNGSPTSVYFKEVFDAERINSYYYRENSPTNELSIAHIDETYIMNGKVLHISGVFSAINTTNREVVLYMLKMAKRHGLSVTLDPNIRLKLWDSETAKKVLTSYLPYVDVLITGEDEAQLLMGTTQLTELAERCEPYGISHIVLKKGGQGAEGFRDGEIYSSPANRGGSLVDTIGAGDGFAAGYLYSMIKGFNLKDSLFFANAVAAYVIGVPGDNEGLPYLDEVEALLEKREHIAR